MLKTRPGYRIYLTETELLMKRLETEEFGLEFGLILHFEMNLTIPKILRVTQAACKVFDKHQNRHTSKVLLRDPWRADKVVHVPRVAPPRHKLEEACKRIYSEIGVQYTEDGKIAFTSFVDVFLQVIRQDSKMSGMPPLESFKDTGIPLVISFDGTGYGNRALNTVVLRNPYMPSSNHQLRIFGLGNVHDDRGGTTQLLGPNLKVINDTHCRA